MRLQYPHRSLLALLAAVTATSAQVNILASSEFQPALEELRKSFSAQTGIPTHAAYGSAGTMAAKAKAPGTDVFLSSNKAWADTLGNSPRAEGPAIILATTPVCIWTRGTGVEPDPMLAQLQRENVGRIAISDTFKSPDGRLAVQAMHGLAGWPEIRRRILMLPDPSDVADSVGKPLPPPEPEDTAVSDTTKDTAKGTVKTRKAVLKAPKLHIPLTDAFLPQPMLWGTPIAGNGRWVTIDTSLAPPLYSSVVRLKSINPTRGDAAKSFVQFLQSPRGRSILRSKGFQPPPE
jgi:ABC-type molybdate transport system substrate-binding protein